MTKLFSIDYFHYYSTPAFFSAYFFPFIAVGKSRAYLDEEFDEKLSNVQNNLHGNFYNYATQGFGNIAFEKQHITFSYFYNRFVRFESEKNKYFNKLDNVPELETEFTRNKVLETLSENGLMLKRNVRVSEEVRKELIHDLKHHEVKFVLAKILYYIVGENHVLPNVDNLTSEISQKLNLNVGTLNVNMAFRSEIDIEANKLNEIIIKAREIQLLCYDAASLFGDEKVYKTCVPKDDIISNAILNNPLINFEIIISEHMDDKKFSEFCVALKHLHVSKSDLSQYSITKIKSLMRETKESKLHLKVTNQALPYALIIFKFEDSNLDFLKIDLYSPFISDNCERPSMYILKKTNPSLFEHFQKTFESMWGSERYSRFI